MIIFVFKLRYMFVVYFGLCFVFVMVVMNIVGVILIVMLMFVLCFEFCCFVIIFIFGLRGLGRYIKMGGLLFVVVILGGMVFLFMMGVVVSVRDVYIVMVILMMGYILVFV